MNHSIHAQGLFSAQSPGNTLESGARLGHFEILGPLGAGGIGEVYRARDPNLGRDVAIKVPGDAHL